MPARRVPIWVGARGPQLVRTAARHADGLFLSGCSTDEHAAIIGNARSVGGSQFALYQSAHDRPGSETELAWDGALRLLTDEVDRWRPASIGINLVEPAQDPGVDLVAVVERAATLLAVV